MRSSSALVDTGLSRYSLTPSCVASITRQRSPCPVSMMIGTFGIGNAPGERTMRTNSAPLDQRHFPVEDDEVGHGRADRLQAGHAVAGLVDFPHADGAEHGAHDFAHVIVVVDDQNLDRPDQIFQMLRQQAPALTSA